MAFLMRLRRSLYEVILSCRCEAHLQVYLWGTWSYIHGISQVLLPLDWYMFLFFLRFIGKKSLESLRLHLFDQKSNIVKYCKITVFLYFNIFRGRAWKKRIGTYCIRCLSSYSSSSTLDSMASHRTAWRKVMKFGTHVEYALNMNQNKPPLVNFHSCLFWLLLNHKV